MRKLLVILLPLLLFGSSLQAYDALIISKRAGHNRYTHGNIDRIIDSLQSRLAVQGMTFITFNVGNNSGQTYGTLAHPTKAVYNVSSSGEGFVETTLEELWWINLPSCVKIINFHATAGDCERHDTTPNTQGNVWNPFSEQFSGAALGNNKHGKSNTNETIFPTALGATLPFLSFMITAANPTGEYIANDEYYNLNDGAVQNDTYWQGNNDVLLRADEDGAFPNGVQIPIMWRLINIYGHTVISLSLGHNNDIVTQGKIQYEIFYRLVDWAVTPCIAPFNIRNEERLREPLTVDPDVQYIWTNSLGQELGISNTPPTTGLVFRRTPGKQDTRKLFVTE